MTQPRRIAMLVGGDEQSGQIWSDRVKLSNSGSTDVYKLAQLPEEHTHAMHITLGYFRQKRRHGFEGYDLLINLITDADQNGGVLEVLERALRGSRVPILNRPAKVRATTREGVAKRLAGIDGLVVPRVRKVRSPSANVLRGLAQAGAMQFPAILRRAGTHSGKVITVITSPDDVEPGQVEAGGYYLTEFVDFRSPDGLYRKYRVFAFGGTLVFRHMIMSDSWNVHMADRERFMMPRPDLIAESQALYERGMENFPPDATAALRGIIDRLGLDFFGIDFGILADGRVVLFEANATMNFFPVSTDPRLAAMQLCVPPAREAFVQMIEHAVRRPTSV